MRIVTAAILVLLWAAPVFAAYDMVVVQSAFDVAKTADRLEEVLKTGGMTIFNRIDHAAGAASVGEELRPTVVLIFGNPKIGSQLLQCAQSVGIDLPQKALIWQDAYGAVWIGYNNPRYLSERHGLVGCRETLDKIDKALMTFAAAAATP